MAHLASYISRRALPMQLLGLCAQQVVSQRIYPSRITARASGDSVDRGSTERSSSLQSGVIQPHIDVRGDFAFVQSRNVDRMYRRSSTRGSEQGIHARPKFGLTSHQDTQILRPHALSEHCKSHQAFVTETMGVIHYDDGDLSSSGESIEPAIELIQHILNAQASR